MKHFHDGIGIFYWRLMHGLGLHFTNPARSTTSGCPTPSQHSPEATFIALTAQFAVSFGIVLDRWNTSGQFHHRLQYLVTRTSQPIIPFGQDNKHART